MKHIQDLTFDEVKQLRHEIVRSSLFLKDYENSLGVDRDEVAYFFEGFDTAINYDMELDNWDNLEEYFNDYKASR